MADKVNFYLKLELIETAYPIQKVGNISMPLFVTKLIQWISNNRVSVLRSFILQSGNERNCNEILIKKQR